MTFDDLQVGRRCFIMRYGASKGYFEVKERGPDHAVLQSSETHLQVAREDSARHDFFESETEYRQWSLKSWEKELSQIVECRQQYLDSAEASWQREVAWTRRTVEGAKLKYKEVKALEEVGSE